MNGERLTISGQVQGVGFRPMVWRIATELGLTGDVKNTAKGVEIRLWGERLSTFITRLQAELPDPARIDDIDRAPLETPAPKSFSIAPSVKGDMRASVTPDMAVCSDCLDEVQDPFARRYRYPFTNCTCCGPRFSIVDGSPYDRDKTSMRDFSMCDDCQAEYRRADDRRFHAQPIACHACGPRAWLEHLGGGAVHAEAFSMMDDVDAAGGALMNGFIVAVKGIGGVHLACDATQASVVARLRERKRRYRKPLALMARDLDVIRRYAEVSQEEAALLSGPAASIVLLKSSGEALPDGISPGLDRHGFMLPYTPLHHLMLRRMKRPVVMTSGNISGQPQCIGNGETRKRLRDVADFALLHDREIVNRIDDSVVRIDIGRPRVLRRARGFAPAPIALPAGFPGEKKSVLALGSELKNTFCLVKDGQAILSQHMGDLEDAAILEDVERNLELYRQLYQHTPSLIAVDAHPGYLSSQRGHAMAGDCPVVEIQHHHAHIAACLVENDRAFEAAPVLGIAMDGLGLGADGTIWGGEFLIADYRGFRRAGCLKPVALPGGTAAVREPWRNAYAHLMAEMGWAEFAMNFGELDVFQRLEAAPRATLDGMLASGVNSPLSSSCGRVFDAAAALAGLAWERQAYEGEAAMHFEAALDESALGEPDDLAYPFTIPLLGDQGIPYIEPLAVWRAMLGDLILKTPVGVMSARFHRGLAKAIVSMAGRLTADGAVDTVALTGGCFQNATLFRLVHQQLETNGLRVLSHAETPANDGGLALGQAVIALAMNQEGN